MSVNRTSAEPLDFTIVTGMSGAGRSTSANVLEDLGYFVIDNVPALLIPKITELARGTDRPTRYALGVDVRSGAFVQDLKDALAELQASGSRTRVLFLEAADPVLVRRYEGNRRPHPLADGARISDGIARERLQLEELKGLADVVIDTTDMNVHDLRDRLRELFGMDSPDVALQTSIVSFGYKHGLPLDVDLVFDCRFLPNPHWVESLRLLTGVDERVRDFVLDQPETGPFLERLDGLFELLLPAYAREGKAYLSIAVGCTGGHHRSVVVARELAKILATHGFHPKVTHRDIDRA